MYVHVVGVQQGCSPVIWACCKMSTGKRGGVGVVGLNKQKKSSAPKWGMPPRPPQLTGPNW